MVNPKIFLIHTEVNRKNGKWDDGVFESGSRCFSFFPFFRILLCQPQKQMSANALQSVQTLTELFTVIIRAKCPALPSPPIERNELIPWHHGVMNYCGGDGMIFGVFNVRTSTHFRSFDWHCTSRNALRRSASRRRSFTYFAPTYHPGLASLFILDFDEKLIFPYHLWGIYRKYCIIG